MNSQQILDNRSQRKPICRTKPETWEGKGTYHYIKWDDGVITSLYDYQDGSSTHLHVVDAAYYEREFAPVWIPEREWRASNPSYHDRLLEGRSYPKGYSWYDAMLALNKVGVSWSFIQPISWVYYGITDLILRLTLNRAQKLKGKVSNI